MKNQFKILMIGPDKDSQGGISSVIKLYSESGLLNNEAIYLSSYKDGNIFFRITFFCVFIIQYLFLLSTDKKIKLIHIHVATKGSFFRKYIVLKIAKLFNKKVIFNVHPMGFVSFYERMNWLVKKMITTALNKSDLVLVLSEIIKLKIANICQNENIKILYNPVVIKEICSRNAELTNVLFLGKLCREKGVYDIIEAAKLVKNPSVIINLYGNGKMNVLKKLVNDIGLQEKVKIKSWVSGVEKDEILRNSDIYVLPSCSEGLPMSILEAMAVGLPIISTPVGGTPEAVEDGVNGFLIQPGDYVTLAEKIDLLASDEHLWQQMRSQSYNLAKEKFDIKIIIKQLQILYEAVLS